MDVRPAIGEESVLPEPASVGSPSAASPKATDTKGLTEGRIRSDERAVTTSQQDGITRSQELFEGRSTSRTARLGQETPAPPLSRSAVGNGLGSSPSLRSSHTLSPSTSDDGLPRTPPSSSSIAMSSSTSSSSFAAQQAAREVIAAGRKKSLGGGGMTPSSSGNVRYDTLGNNADEAVDVSRGATPVPPKAVETQYTKGRSPSPPPSSPPSEAAPKTSPAAPSPPVIFYKVTPIPTRTSSMTGFPPSKEISAATAATAPPTTTTAATAPAAAAARPKRTGGGSIRRPPPGKMLNLADLDASDDEYEPGWANVISSTR